MNAARGLAIAAALLCLCPVPPAAAQRAADALATRILREDGTWQDLSPRHGGFSLFAESDLAGTSLKLTGSYRYPAFNVSGLCPFANTSGDEYNSSCGQYNGTSTFFHFQSTWGTSPSGYARIHAVWPGVANMMPPLGYSTPWRITSLAPTVRRIVPADDQFGTVFSGVTGTSDGSCRDMNGAQGAGLPRGMTLMAASDCTETWGSEGFRGMHLVPDSAWLQRFHADPSGFRWDDWRIPASALANTPTAGDLTTYGYFSDYGRDVLTRYGNVTPKGPQNQPTLERGFPLGIQVRYDVFKFDRGSLRDGVFIRWLVINRSADVWGQGIDYDSLYMGGDPGYVLGGPAPSAYNVPSLGLHIATGGGFTAGRCNNVFPRRTLPGVNEPCGGTTTHSHVSMILKSPLGDLRNKLFSDPSSLFYSPANPKADDTLTFNHWVKGGFGAQDNFSWRRSDRALFGLMSGVEELWLDGRSATEFSATQIWNFFRYEFTDGTQSAANLRYTRSVPGSIPGYGKWDYNDDGIQDTLFLPDCGSKGCSKLWSDSTAGGYSNRLAGNIGNYLGFGPFRLNAGDTTEVLWFLGAAKPDTLSGNVLIRNVLDAYMNNFHVLGPPPAPTFTPADVQITSAFARDTLNNSEVRIRIRMSDPQPDQYLGRVVARLQSNDPAAVEIRKLNPGIVAAVQGRMRQNLAQVLVFKSCDLGKTWTSGACTTEAAARPKTPSGIIIPPGWDPFRQIPADSITGALNSHSVVDVVPAGHEYLYSFVTQSRSLANIRVVYSETRDTAGTVLSHKIGTLSDALGIDVDTVWTALAQTGPTTVRVYAPISVPAGTIAAHIDTVRQQGSATNRVAISVRSARVEGTYRLRFGNRFILTRTYDTVSGARTTTLVRQSVYTRAADAGGTLFTPANTPAFRNGSSFAAAGSAVTYVAAADTFAANRSLTYATTGGSAPAPVLRATPRTTTGTVQKFIDTLNSTGYVLAGGAGKNEPYYLWVSNTATSFLGSLFQPTSEFEGAAWYPGFHAGINNEIAPPSARLFTVTTDRGDSVSTKHVDSAGVKYQTGALRSAPGGTYRLEWSDDAYGPGAPFAFDNAEALQPVLNASLERRAVGSVTDTTSDILDRLSSRALILSGTNNLAGRPLIAARVPFRLTGVNGTPATMVMVQRHATGSADSAVRNSRLFGTKGDTTRVAIPPDAWVPGDTLYVIESLVTDSTALVGNVQTIIVHDSIVNGQLQSLPIQVTRRVYGAMLVFGCNSNTTPTRITCNPVKPGLGASAYATYRNGCTATLKFNRPFDQNSEVVLTASPADFGGEALTEKQLNQVKVVPNPFVVTSAFDAVNANGAGTGRVLFVNVPQEGLLRIYTISGQLVQQLSWTPGDLVTSGDNSTHGDLPYNLRTREGSDLASGVYMFVLTPRGTAANGKAARGKFVVIR
ncbi:MAG TPA: hypothetical protein VE967_05740 [Gemmatimonadaceae bacterium]|nr:hypothetical protein [Gemmatimonadaceae bacterium]